MESQSIAYLFNGSEHIYWILDLEGEVHSIWDSTQYGDTPHIDTLCNARVWVDFLGGLH
jgi:hypothetical protein